MGVQGEPESDTIKAKVSRVRKKHLGIRKPSTFACSRNSKWKRKINGEVVAR